MARVLHRGRLETTVEARRAPLGVEPPRQGSDVAIDRTPPCRWGWSSIVARWAPGRSLAGRLTVRRRAWEANTQATCRDALAVVRQPLWAVESVSTSTAETEWVNMPRVSLEGLRQAVCETH